MSISPLPGHQHTSKETDELYVHNVHITLPKQPVYDSGNSGTMYLIGSAFDMIVYVCVVVRLESLYHTLHRRKLIKTRFKESSCEPMKLRRD